MKNQPTTNYQTTLRVIVHATPNAEYPDFVGVYNLVETSNEEYAKTIQVLMLSIEIAIRSQYQSFICPEEHYNGFLSEVEIILTHDNKIGCDVRKCDLPSDTIKMVIDSIICKRIGILKFFGLNCFVSPKLEYFKYRLAKLFA
ncbi:TPA: hypothetical protein ACPP66_000169 [Haemophilus influenzae]|uniref:Uncharacterized protein n=1 Tax=Haemophilus influenzae TaxID=727 RepID=A0AAX3IPL8_HAEIF|nr:hypothetical protein [Haemophilus influenzae]VTX47942.1 Uncharacterised protein [Haemophilus influenzae]